VLSEVSGVRCRVDTQNSKAMELSVAPSIDTPVQPARGGCNEIPNRVAAAP
jgi:hypothetical protein